MAKKQERAPVKINILGKEYTLKIVPNLKAGEQELYGIVDNLSRTMLLSNNDQADFEETIIHESIHVISDALTLNISEKQTRALSCALYDLFKRNDSIEFNMIKLRGELENGE